MNDRMNLVRRETWWKERFWSRREWNSEWMREGLVVVKWGRERRKEWMTEEANEEEERSEWRRDWVKSCREGRRERDGREYENLEKVGESKMIWVEWVCVWVNECEWVDKVNESVSELHKSEWDEWDCMKMREWMIIRFINITLHLHHSQSYHITIIHILIKLILLNSPYIPSNSFLHHSSSSSPSSNHFISKSDT